MKRLAVALEQNWGATARLSARAGALRSFDCRGRIQLQLGPSAVVISTHKNFVGVAVMGLATRHDDTTVIVVASGGRLELGGVSIGRGSTLNVHANASLSIGRGTFVNDGTYIAASKLIDIGKDCAISWGVTILDSDGHRHGERADPSPVRIQDRVWLGCNVTILKGVTVGEGSIVGAGAVVTRSCPPKSLLVGAPARVAKSGVEWHR